LSQPENFQETLLISSRFPGWENYSSRFPGFPGVLDTLFTSKYSMLWLLNVDVVEPFSVEIFSSSAFAAVTLHDGVPPVQVGTRHHAGNPYPCLFHRRPAAGPRLPVDLSSCRHLRVNRR